MDLSSSLALILKKGTGEREAEMMNWNGDGSGWMGGGWGMGLFCIILIGVAVILTVFLFKSSKREIRYESPRQTLDRRFAEGNLDAETYAQARRLLEGPSE